MKQYVLSAFLVLSILGCAVKAPVGAGPTPTAPVLIPGSNSQFDQDTYRTLATIHAFAAAASANPAVLTANQKQLLNQLNASINAAVLVYDAYHVGQATQAQVTAAMVSAQNAQSAFSAAGVN